MVLFCEAGDILDFGFKARVDPALACFTTFRFSFECNTCWCLGGQHGWLITFPTYISNRGRRSALVVEPRSLTHHLHELPGQVFMGSFPLIPSTEHGDSSPKRILWNKQRNVNLQCDGTPRLPQWFPQMSIFSTPYRPMVEAEKSWIMQNSPCTVFLKAELQNTGKPVSKVL